MKNKSNWFLLLFLFLSVSVFSQDIVHRWAKQMGGIYGNDYINSIAIDSFGNLYSIGNFERTMDFDPDTGVSNLVSKGFNDIFIQKLDRNGKLIWAKGIGGSGYEWGSSITLDSKGNVYATGGFQDTVDFDPSIGIDTLSFVGSNDVFIHKSNIYYE